MKFFIAVAAILYASQGFSFVTEEDAVSAQDMSSWVNSFQDRAPQKIRELGLNSSEESYTECFEVVEVASAYICASQYQVNMNLALARASFYVEGLSGTPARTVVKNDNPNVKRYLRLIGGHDLKSQDLVEFWEAASLACEKDDAYCPNSQETDLFETFILPMADRGEDFVVITFANISGMDWTEVVTHEIMHAQFFLEAGYEKAAKAYWENNVTDLEKEFVKRTLSRYYDASNDYLMMNEFQAYILMSGAEFNLLAQLVEKHRQPLINALAAEGVEPVQVK